MKVSVSVDDLCHWRERSLAGLPDELHLFVLVFADGQAWRIAIEDARSGAKSQVDIMEGKQLPPNTPEQLRTIAAMLPQTASRERRLEEFLRPFLPEVTELEVARIVQVIEVRCRAHDAEMERRRARGVGGQPAT